MRREKILISGGPGYGKTTLANQERQRLGMAFFMCTDTKAQAHRSRGPSSAPADHCLYAPSQFDNDWSGLSQWVSETWLRNGGPWVIEGVAVIRALRKWRDAMIETCEGSVIYPPCTKLIRLMSPQMVLTSKQEQMARADDTRFSELMAEWPELHGVVQYR